MRRCWREGSWWRRGLGSALFTGKRCSHCHTQCVNKGGARNKQPAGTTGEEQTTGEIRATGEEQNDRRNFNDRQDQTNGEIRTTGSER